MTEVERGMSIVVGHAGVRVFPEERGEAHSDVRVHGERRLDREAQGGRRSARSPASWSNNRRTGGKTLVVGGPAIVHTGSGRALVHS